MLILTAATLPAAADEADGRRATDESASDVDAALLEYLGSWESSDEEWLWLEGDDLLDESFDKSLDKSLEDSLNVGEAAEDEETTAGGRQHLRTEPGAAEGQER